MSEYDTRKLQIASRLRNLIYEHYKTLDEFANDFGYDTRTISNWVNKGIDSFATIYEICDYFNVDFDQFIKLNKED